MILPLINTNNPRTFSLLLRSRGVFDRHDTEAVFLFLILHFFGSTLKRYSVDGSRAAVQHSGALHYKKTSAFISVVIAYSITKPDYDCEKREKVVLPRGGTITSPVPAQLLVLEESKSSRHAPPKANHPSCFPTQCRLMITLSKCNLALKKNNSLVSEFCTYFKQKKLKINSQ